MNFVRNKNAIDRDKSMAIPWWRYVLIATLGLIITGILSYGFYAGDRMVTMYAPLVDSAMEIKLETTAAHLWLEEILSGDRHETVEKVWEHLDKANWYVQAMLQGGRNLEGTFIPLNNAERRQEIKAMQKTLVKFRDVTKQRLAAKETAAAGTDVDQRYDAIFMDFITQADHVETRLQQIMAQDLRSFRYIQVSMIVTCMLIFLFIGIAFARFDRLRAKDFLSLHESNVNLAKEMSERKEAEKALRESEAKYRAMFENIGNGVAVCESVNNGEDFIFVDFNKAAEVIERINREALIGKSILTGFPGIKDFGLFEVYQRVWKTGEPEEFPVSIYKDERITGWRENYVYKLPSGEVVAVSTDETERMQAQEERESLVVELEEKNAELERFTYTVSHDLKSPLITIKGFLGLLEKDAEEGNKERMKADIVRISNAAEKMQHLLEELLELSRIGRMVNPPEEVSFGDLVRKAVDVVAGRLAEGNVQVEMTPELPVIYGDSPRIQEVLENLIDNAVKFMGDQSNPLIEIGTRRDFKKTAFYVRDNGVGIDPRYHEKVFGLFDKLDQNTDGTGVGLAIVKRIVEVHGGRIWVESEGIGKGTAFCFTLPDRKE